MAKFNNRSWELNRFKGLYPGVIKDLDGFDDFWLHETIFDIELEMSYEPLDLDTPEGVEKLKKMVDSHIQTWNEVDNG